MQAVSDYIVVGSGPAGCVLASRLSEDPNVRVLLLEAGGSDRKLKIAMPAALPFTYHDPSLDWGENARPEPSTNNAVIDEKRVLGGGTSITRKVTGNLSGPIRMIGEKIADSIRNRGAT